MITLSLCLYKILLFSTMIYGYLSYCLKVSLMLSFAYASLRKCLLHGQGSRFQKSFQKTNLPTIFSNKVSSRKGLSFPQS